MTQTMGRLDAFYRQREAKLKLERVQLNRMVEQVIDLTRARWSDMPQQRGILVQVRTDLSMDLPDVAGIESEIREALINLVFNAVDAMPEGGAVTLRTSSGQSAAERHYVHVEVCDTGVGMDEEARRRCLEPFFTTKGERGTGLGLAMVYGIATRHNAELAIESVVGEGTTVRLSFPMVSIAAEGAPTTVNLRPLPSRLKILIIDDDPLVINSLRDILESEGNFVTPASGGQEGIDAFQSANDRQDHFDIVITDLGMPHINGRKVAEAIKARRSAVPVIMLTGWGRRLLADEEATPYVDRVLAKPVDPFELRAVIAQLVHGVGPPVQ
jgi:CheY-like chemotaxis protein/anti-sigma regulatory factor (Ser/Thr protein kinase)